VRRAYRTLRGAVSVLPFSSQDCLGRVYNRLNQDYHPLHALCRFFLEHTGPSHEAGDRTVLPFLVNMARLYEMFVAHWLEANLPADLRLKKQEWVRVGENDELNYQIDLVLCDAATGRTLCVLDTKYKANEGPAQTDVNQAVTYAEIKDCTEAVLIYPVPLAPPLNVQMGRIRVQSLTFSLEGDLEQAGQAFLRDLLRSGCVGER
jgi:5-methylcytosine-specific restriction enzyme subunit McrC